MNVQTVIVFTAHHMTFVPRRFGKQWNAANTGNRRKWGKMMNQQVTWLNQLYTAEYELKNCQTDLGVTDKGLQSVMEQIECTGRHLLNLALEMKQELKKQ